MIFLIILFFTVNSLFGVGAAEKYFFYEDSPEFSISIGKDTLLNNLHTVAASINVEDDGTFKIQYKMFPLEKSTEGYGRFAFIPYQSDGDAIFSFHFGNDETNEIITLFYADYKIWPFVTRPDENGMATIFRQGVIDYLLDKRQIHFSQTQDRYINTEFEFHQILRSDVFVYNPHFSQFFSPPAMTIEPIEDKNSINELFKFDWILERIEFPQEYHWYRYPERMITFQYKLNEEETNREIDEIMYTYTKKINEAAESPGIQDMYRRDMETRLENAGLRTFSVAIWQNGDQYFCQLSNNTLFYFIDFDILKNILGEKIYIVN